MASCRPTVSLRATCACLLMVMAGGERLRAPKPKGPVSLAESCLELKASYVCGASDSGEQQEVNNLAELLQRWGSDLRCIPIWCEHGYDGCCRAIEQGRRLMIQHARQNPGQRFIAIPTISEDTVAEVFGSLPGAEAPEHGEGVVPRTELGVHQTQGSLDNEVDSQITAGKKMLKHVKAFPKTNSSVQTEENPKVSFGVQYEETPKVSSDVQPEELPKVSTGVQYEEPPQVSTGVQSEEPPKVSTGVQTEAARTVNSSAQTDDDVNGGTKSYDKYIRWSKDPHMCMNVVNGFAGDGGRIQMYPCPLGYPDEEYILPAGREGAIRLKRNPSKCLNVPFGVATPGTKIKIWECDENDPSFRFVLPEGRTGHIRLSAHRDMCLNVDNYFQIQVHRCFDDMQFILPVKY